MNKNTCPECGESSEGTTYLWELEVISHQCKNGHMWSKEA